MTVNSEQCTVHRIRVTNHTCPPKPRRRRKSRVTNRGAILILTFIIMVTLIAITVAFLYMTSTQLRGSGYDVTSSKAFWLAEAGLQRYIYLLKNDSDYRDDYPDLNADLEDGSYLVEASYDEDTNTYTLTSTGTVGVLNRKVEQNVVVAEGTQEAFNYVQHSGGNIDFKDSEGTITGDISAGNQLKNEGGMEIDGTITEDSSVVTPSVDYDSYKAIADHVENGNKTFQAGQTYNGIWYVKKKATIKDNVTINGSIIAKKDIVLKNSEGVTINPDSGYPALVSKKNITGEKLEDSTINGLVYAKQNITLDKNEDNTFNGTMIAGGKIDMKKGAGLEINYDSDILSNPPPYFSGGGEITVSLQKDWNEIIPAI